MKKSKGKIILKQTNDFDRHYFIVVHANGQAALSSQMYASQNGALNGIESVKKNASEKSLWKLQTLDNKAGYHFSLYSNNGQVLCSSAIYKSKSTASKAMKKLIEIIPEMPTERG